MFSFTCTVAWSIDISLKSTYDSFMTLGGDFWDKEEGL